MSEADCIDDDNSDNVVENQPESEDFISEVGQPVSATESEDDDHLFHYQGHVTPYLCISKTLNQHLTL